MTTKKKRLLLVLLSVLAVSVVGAEIETRVMRGLINGEAFFKGRPTSYWSRRLRATYPLGGNHNTSFSQSSPELERWLRRLGVSANFTRSVSELWHDGFPLQEGDENAVPVLMELTHDSEWHVGCVAIRGLVRVGKKSEPVLERLAELARDKNVFIWTDAVGALKALDPEGAIEARIK